MDQCNLLQHSWAWQLTMVCDGAGSGAEAVASVAAPTTVAASSSLLGDSLAPTSDATFEAFELVRARPAGDANGAEDVTADLAGVPFERGRNMGFIPCLASGTGGFLGSTLSGLALETTFSLSAGFLVPTLLSAAATSFD